MVKENVRKETREIAERLKELLEGRSVRGFAMFLELPHTTVVQYVHGKVDIPGSALAHICTQTSTSGHWLLTGKGPRHACELELTESTNDKDWIELVKSMKRCYDRGDMRAIGKIEGILMLAEEQKSSSETAEERETRTNQRRA